MDGRTDEWIDGWMHRRTNKWMDGRTHRQTHERMNEWPTFKQLPSVRTLSTVFAPPSAVRPSVLPLPAVFLLPLFVVSTKLYKLRVIFCPGFTEISQEHMLFGSKPLLLLILLPPMLKKPCCWLTLKGRWRLFAHVRCSCPITVK